MASAISAPSRPSQIVSKRWTSWWSEVGIGGVLRFCLRTVVYRQMYYVLQPNQPMASEKSKRPRDQVTSIRVPVDVKRHAIRAAKAQKMKLNGFMVAAIREKTQRVLGTAPAA